MFASPPPPYSGQNLDSPPGGASIATRANYCQSNTCLRVFESTHHPGCSQIKPELLDEVLKEFEIAGEPEYPIPGGSGVPVPRTMATTTGLTRESVYLTNPLLDSGYRPPYYRRQGLPTSPSQQPVRTSATATVAALPVCVTSQQAQTGRYPLPVTPPSDRRRTADESVAETAFSTSRSRDTAGSTNPSQQSLSHTISVRQADCRLQPRHTEVFESPVSSPQAPSTPDTHSLSDQSEVYNANMQIRTSTVPCRPQKPLQPPKAVRLPQRRGAMQLWQFLLSLLDENDGDPLLVEWTDTSQLEFRLLNPEEVAIRWGRIKHRPAMNYDKLSRSLRYYYDKGIMQKVSGERYVYKFTCPPELLYSALGDRDGKHAARFRKPLHSQPRQCMTRYDCILDRKACPSGTMPVNHSSGQWRYSPYAYPHVGDHHYVPQPSNNTLPYLSRYMPTTKH